MSRTHDFTLFTHLNKEIYLNTNVEMIFDAVSLSDGHTCNFGATMWGAECPTPSPSNSHSITMGPWSNGRTPGS